MNPVLKILVSQVIFGFIINLSSAQYSNFFTKHMHSYNKFIDVETQRNNKEPWTSFRKDTKHSRILRKNLIHRKKLKKVKNEEKQPVAKSFEEVIVNSIECGNGTAKAVVTIFTDDYPEETSWYMENIDTKSMLYNSGSSFYAKRRTIYKHEICLHENGNHKFVILDSYYDGLCTPNALICGYYQVTINNSTFFTGSAFYFNEEIHFLICSSDADCQDGNECTVDSCTANVCQREPLPCLECDGIKINFEIQTDDSPYSYSWMIINMDKNIVSLTGGGYEAVNYLYQEEFCLSKENFVFEIRDSGRDGMCQIGSPYCGYFNLLVENEVQSTTQFILSNNVDRYSPDNYYLAKSWDIIRTPLPLSSYCSVDSECDTSDPCKVEYCNLQTKQCAFSSTEEDIKECRKLGNKTAIVIHVTSLDSETTPSERLLVDSFFGINGNAFTMKSQFFACSFGKFNIEAYDGVTETNEAITNGVINIQIDENIIGLAPGMVADMVLKEARYKYGDIERQFDLVILCLPPGAKIGDSTNWKAYAFVNSYLSVYNDRSCIYPSVQMHEIGHNLGLSHSNNESNYGDETGMMGLSYNQTNGPVKCFNAAKSFQLEWYQDSQLVLDVFNIPFYQHQIGNILVGVADYGLRGTKSTVLKLLNAEEGYDYYIMYNRQVGINSGSLDGADKVQIVKRKSGTFYEDSTLEATLSNGFFFSINNQQHESSLHILANFFLDRDPPFIDIWFYKQIFDPSSLCFSDDNCDDGDSCTIDACSNDTYYYGTTGNQRYCTHTQKECSDCGATIKIETLTNGFPNDIAWDISSIKSRKALISSPYYTQSNTLYVEEHCLEYGKYMFSFYYAANYTSPLDPLAFKLYIESFPYDNEIIQEESFLETFFIICASDEDCRDFDGCTIDFCNQETKTCNNTQLEDVLCSDCSRFTLNLTLDNFPIETQWRLNQMDTAEFVLSGNPYAYDVSEAYGRRKAPTRTNDNNGSIKNGRRKAPTRAASRHQGTTEDIEDIEVLNREENAYGNIFQHICLENNVLYHYIITDSFGDGICCSEGTGSFVVRLENKNVLKGGNFSDSDEVLFKHNNCVSNQDCSDNNFCTIDVCDVEIFTCFYFQKPCEECGEFAVVEVFTDVRPLQHIWYITQNQSEVLRGGPYYVSLSSFTTTQCFPFGTYKFSITTKNFEGMAQCFPGYSCGYNVVVKHIRVIESEGLTGPGSDYYFGVCYDDSHCNDNDDCTYDYCDVTNRICKFDQLPCAACGKSEVRITFSTDQYPMYSVWKVKISNEDDYVWIGGPYLWYSSYRTYISTKCLAPGIYEFTLTETEFPALTSCFYEYVCGYSISIDDEILIESFGGYQYNHPRKQTFSTVPKIELSLLSSPPSITHIPSEIPSFVPSAAISLPSILPSHFYDRNQNNWAINFIELSHKPNVSSALDGFFLYYNISKGKSIDQLVSRLYDSSCQLENNETNIFSISGKKIEDLTSGTFSRATIEVKIQKSFLRESSYLKNKSEQELSISFCIRTELVSENIMVSFSEVKIHVRIDLLSSTFRIGKLYLNKPFTSEIDKESHSEVDACICYIINAEKYDCQSKFLLHQNDDVNICVFSKNGMVIKQFESISFYQDNILKYKAIENGQAASLTSAVVGSIGVIKTVAVSSLFNHPSPSPVAIIGTVQLDFIRSRNLDFVDSIENEKNEAYWEIIAPLSDANKSNFTISRYTTCVLGLILLCFALSYKREHQYHLIFEIE